MMEMNRAGPLVSLGLIAFSMAASSQDDPSHVPSSMVIIGSTLRVSWEKMPPPLKNPAGSILINVGGDRGVCGIYARRGHLWQARVDLKKISKDFHIRIELGPWPTELKGPITVWENGRLIDMSYPKSN